MIRIAVVDDEPKAIDLIVRKIKEIEKQLGVTFEIDTFTSGSDLLNVFYANQYQSLLLDLDMPDKTGFDISAALRKSRNGIPIVYITNRDDLMQQAFQYKVLGFVRKNNLDQELPFAMTCIVQEIQNNLKTITVISSKRQQKCRYELNISDIIYIESEDHFTKIHVSTLKEPIITRESLSFYCEKEGFEDFIQINISCIVNYRFIFSIEKDELTLLDKSILYISRRKTKLVKEQFLHLTRRLIL